MIEAILFATQDPMTLRRDYNARLPHGICILAEALYICAKRLCGRGVQLLPDRGCPMPLRTGRRSGIL